MTWTCVNYSIVFNQHATYMGLYSPLIQKVVSCQLTMIYQQFTEENKSQYYYHAMSKAFSKYLKIVRVSWFVVAVK